MITIDAARRHSDADLLSAATRLAAAGREVTADLVALLAVLVERGLYAGEGYGSAHDFCVVRLCLSDAQAYHRLAAAQVAARFPQVLDGLRSGALTLTNVALLRPHLTEANAARLLAWAEGRRKQEVEREIRRFAPRPDVAPSLRRLPAATRRGAQEAPPSVERMPVTACPASCEVEPPLARPPAPPGPALHDFAVNPIFPAPSGRPEVRPLSPSRYSLRVTISEETHAKLRRARDLLGHAVPDGDLAEVLDRALTLLVERLEQRKCGAKKVRGGKAEAGSEQPTTVSHAPAPAPAAPALVLRPQPTPSMLMLAPPARPHRSRYIPAAVRRAVWERDQGRCAFVGHQGRCAQTRRLEFHHRVPFAERGAPSVENIVLACKLHNGWEAARWFGEEAVPAGARTGGAAAVERARAVTREREATILTSQNAAGEEMKGRGRGLE